MVKAILGHIVSCVLNFGSCAQFLKCPTVHWYIDALPLGQYLSNFMLVDLCVCKKKQETDLLRIRIKFKHNSLSLQIIGSYEVYYECSLLSPKYCVEGQMQAYACPKPAFFRLHHDVHEVICGGNSHSKHPNLTWRPISPITRKINCSRVHQF